MWIEILDNVYRALLLLASPVGIHFQYICCICIYITEYKEYGRTFSTCLQSRFFIRTHTHICRRQHLTCWSLFAPIKLAKSFSHLIIYYIIWSLDINQVWHIMTVNILISSTLISLSTWIEKQFSIDLCVRVFRFGCIIYTVYWKSCVLYVIHSKEPNFHLMWH